MPYLTIDLTRLEHNAALICRQAGEQGVSIFAVTKVLCGAPPVAEVFLAAGAAGIADSRLENIARLRQAGVEGPFVLLRVPTLSAAAEVVALADISLNSELATCQALSCAAQAMGATHQIILMVDVGDLREGVWPADFLFLLEAVKLLPGLKIVGVGTNLACFGGVIPDESNQDLLTGLAKQAEQTLGLPMLVSGGNSSSLALLAEKKLGRGVNNLRIGEGIILGRETINRAPLPGAHLDACLITAEIIELKSKPSVPLGTISQDAFGNVPSFVDRGLQMRAILDIGRQDTVPEGLTPLLEGCEVLGGSSDHLILDVTKASALAVGDHISFIPSYGALLAAATSPYVKKVYVR
ncbi:MAG: Ornithine racemase [Firmicutes bacterium]|nr:Ornithine racemase [Bacillota bacterium]